MAAPYAQYVGDSDPVVVLGDTLAEYRALQDRLTAADWPRPVAPGKWTIRQVIVHATQYEMILGHRLRCGVGMPDYEVQPVVQDDLIFEAGAVDGPTALAAWLAVRAMNLALATSLSPVDRQRQVRHPERGVIDVDDILTTLAGHAVHHLRQVQAVIDGAEA